MSEPQPKPDKRAYLISRGWIRDDVEGNEMWRSERWLGCPLEEALVTQFAYDNKEERKAWVQFASRDTGRLDSSEFEFASRDTGRLDSSEFADAMLVEYRKRFPRPDL